MKVTFNQDYTVAIDGNTIVTFEQNTTHELADDKAAIYVERGVCRAETPKNKMAAPVIETAVQKRPHEKKGK